MSTKWRDAIQQGAWLLLVFALRAGGEERGTNTPLWRETWQSMGTLATLSMSSQEKMDPATGMAICSNALLELEGRLSVFKPDSEISRLRESAGKAPVAVSPSTFEILTLARHYAGISGGCFDPTVLPLVRLWGFNGGAKRQTLPTDQEISHAKALVDYRQLILTNGTAFLEKAGMSVDLGGIAKGYAVDVCWERLRNAGARDFMVDLGGNLRVSGHPRPGDDWIVGIRNPFNGNQLVGRLRMGEGMAVGTSGNYERFVTIAGRRYTHIVDPRSGRPVEGMAAVTVVGTTAMEADVVSKPPFILGAEGSKAFMMATPKCQLLFISDAQPLRIQITSGLRSMFTPESGIADSVIELDGAAQLRGEGPHGKGP